MVTGYTEMINIAGCTMRTATGQRTASLSYPAVSDTAASYDYRYEFSETRKVLEEFFKAENEFPASGGEAGEGQQPQGREQYLQEEGRNKYFENGVKRNIPLKKDHLGSFRI